MPTYSGSYDFSLQRDQIVTNALQLIHAIDGGSAATGDTLTDAVTRLNLMLKHWQNDGLQLWTVEELDYGNTEGLTAGVYKYTMGVGEMINTKGRPEEIIDVYRRKKDTLVKVPLIRNARQKYYHLSDEDVQGFPTQWYLDRQLIPVLRIWPAPNQDFQDNYQLVILYQQPFDDMDSSTDNLLFPQSWELAVVWGLASLLATEYGLPMTERQYIETKAKEIKQQALDWNWEYGSIFFVTDPRSQYSAWRKRG